MESERTPRFWELARRVVAEARRQGLVVPGFRSPPRMPGALRTVRRHPGGALVAVVWRGRSPMAVMADMVDGLVLVNGLVGPDAVACRRRLWAGLVPSVEVPGDVALTREVPPADLPPPVVEQPTVEPPKGRPARHYPATGARANPGRRAAVASVGAAAE